MLYACSRFLFLSLTSFVHNQKKHAIVSSHFASIIHAALAKCQYFFGAKEALTASHSEFGYYYFRIIGRILYTTRTQTSS